MILTMFTFQVLPFFLYFPITLENDINTHYHLFYFILLLKMRSDYIAQVGLKLLTSSNPPALSSQNAEITGVGHCAQPDLHILHLPGNPGICGGSDALV